MSVLLDCHPTNGALLSIVCGKYHARDAAKTLRWLKTIPGIFPYMQHHELVQDKADLPSESIGLSSPHYYNHKNEICFVTPENDAMGWIDDVLECDILWATVYDDEVNADVKVYDPGFTKRLPKEYDRKSAAIALAANHWLHFSSNRRHDNTRWKLIVEPLLTKNCIFGMQAVGAIIADYLVKGEVWDSFKHAGRSNNIDNTDYIKEFVALFTACQIAISPNEADAIAAAQRSGHIDPCKLKDCCDALVMVAAAKICRYAMKSTGKRGHIGKNQAIITKKYRRLLESNHPSAAIDREWIEGQIARDIKGVPTSTPLCYRKSTVPGFAIVPDSQLVVIVVGRKRFVLDDEAIKALEFAGVTHAMWHFHAATIPVEYAASQSELNAPPLAAETMAMVGQLRANVAHVVGMAGGANRVKAHRVSKAQVMDTIDDLWRFYRRVFIRLHENNLHNRTGRYFHDIQSLTEAAFAGRLAKRNADEQKVEIIEKWRAVGEPIEHDIESFMDIVGRHILTVSEDFGRFAKIVPPFESCSLFSFIRRANAMLCPNDRGKLVWIDEEEWNYRVEPFPDGEEQAARDGYKCALRVIVATSVITSRIKARMTSDMVERTRDMSYRELVDFVDKQGIPWFSPIGIRAEPRYTVPEEVYYESRQQAQRFVNESKIPTTEWAGAWLEIENSFPYKKLGDPALAHINPTAVCPTSLRESMSSVEARKVAVATGSQLGNKVRSKCNKVTAVLAGKMCSRAEAIAYDGYHTSSVDNKVETQKDPYKDRTIVTQNPEAFWIASEVELNTRESTKNAVGVAMGADPTGTARRIYAMVSDRLDSSECYIYGVFDLESFSTGMPIEDQDDRDEVLFDAFDLPEDEKALLRVKVRNITTKSIMLHNQKYTYIPFFNKKGADFEGLRGSGNTFAHTGKWYRGRCMAARYGVEGFTNAFLFIDDGAYGHKCRRSDSERYSRELRKCFFKSYVAGGWKPSVLKMYSSDIQMEFLHEIYRQCIHVAYSLRAFCHLCAQYWPDMDTPVEELLTIASGVTGAHRAGGHPLRLTMGYGFAVYLWINGYLGKTGHVLQKLRPDGAAIFCCLPTIGGGLSAPGYTETTSNLAGHPDAEALDHCGALVRLISQFDTMRRDAFREYVKAHLTMESSIETDLQPTRARMDHPASREMGAKGRSNLIVESAMKVCKCDSTMALIRGYCRSQDRRDTSTFRSDLLRFFRENDLVVPVELAQRALSCDTETALVRLVDKIASSRLLPLLVGSHAMKMQRGIYRKALERRVENFNAMWH